MRRKRLIGIALVIVLLGGALAWFLATFSFSAQATPGPVETYLATAAKKFFIGRAARGELPREPADDAASRKLGRINFAGSCASCHGFTGRQPSDLGKSLYPPALDLGGPEVQGWSNRELFWIVKNGIRLSGMPGFARVSSDQDIWHMVHYIRSLGGAAPAGEAPAEAAP